MIEKQHLKNIFEKFPSLLSVIKQLNSHHIDYLIGGSGCLYVFGNERFPGDIDIYVRYNQHDTVDALFGVGSFQFISPQENVRNSNPENNHDIQITSNLVITKNEHEHHFEINDTIWNSRKIVPFEEEKIIFLAPEECLLLKAILDRGPEVDKNDRADIQNFLKIYPAVDHTYLARRKKELGVSEESFSIFNSL